MTAPAPPRAVLRTDGGVAWRLDTRRWHAAADGPEVAVLDGLAGPVLDGGCGPGRVVEALASSGRVVLGIDPSPRAVAESRRRRVPVLRRSVFDPLPGEGRWGTVVLLDGNIGIGGAPVILLARAAELLAPGGQVLAEVEPPGCATEAFTVRVEATGSTAGEAAVGPWFPWARVGAERFGALAAAAGLRPEGLEVAAGRWFARATAPGVVVRGRPYQRV